MTDHNDIDFQLRYSEHEQPEVAAFLGYEQWQEASRTANWIESLHGEDY